MAIGDWLEKLGGHVRFTPVFNNFFLCVCVRIDSKNQLHKIHSAEKLHTETCTLFQEINLRLNTKRYYFT